MNLFLNIGTKTLASGIILVHKYCNSFFMEYTILKNFEELFTIRDVTKLKVKFFNYFKEREYYYDSSDLLTKVYIFLFIRYY